MSPSRKAPPAAVVGLDIGSDSIKVAEAKYGKDGITITAIGIAPTPPGMIDNEVIVDPVGLGAAIKALLSDSGIKTKQCVSAVSGQAKVVVRVIEVPKMAPNELAETMKWEVERHVPFSPSQVIMDFQPLEKEDDPNAQNMEVLLAVAQDEMIDSHVKTIQAAGLKPVAIDIEPLAVGRSLIEVAKNGVKEEVIAIVNIGSRNTDLEIFENGNLTFPSPPLPYAGTTFTHEIAEVLGQTPEQAETLKKEYASVDLSAFATPPYGAPEPTTMGAVDDVQDQTSGLSFVAPDDSQPATAEPAEEPAQGFHVTADGPVFDLGQPAEAADSGAPQFDLSDPAEPAVPPAGPVFDLGEPVEPSASEGPSFDLGGTYEPTQAAKPVFDLDDAEPTPEEHSQVEDSSVAPPPVVAPVPVQSAYQPGSTEESVFRAISSVLADLANEIRRSLEYYTTRYNKSPERIFLCGGTAKIPHLDEFLTQELGVKVEVADPISSLKVKVPSASDRYLHEISPMLAVSIGLAIRDMVG